jgi:hypothetical protein
VLYATTLVGEAAAFGIPHPTLGQAIAVIVTPPPGGTLDAAVLMKECRERLPAYMVPATIDIRDGPLPAQSQRQDRPQDIERRLPGDQGLSARGTRRPVGPSPDDCLLVGGVALPKLAERVGRTPFYAYDRRMIDARVGELRRHLPPLLKLHYAMKANPMPSLVAFMAASSTASTLRRAASSRLRSTPG